VPISPLQNKPMEPSFECWIDHSARLSICWPTLHCQADLQWINKLASSNSIKHYHSKKRPSVKPNKTPIPIKGSLLRSHFLGRRAKLPEETTTHIRTFFSIVFVVCLRSVEQNNHVTETYEWRKLLREKSGYDRKPKTIVLFMAQESLSSGKVTMQKL